MFNVKSLMLFFRKSEITQIDLSSSFQEEAYFKKIRSLPFEFKEGGQEIWENKFLLNKDALGKRILNFAELWAKFTQHELSMGTDLSNAIFQSYERIYDCPDFPQNQCEIFYAAELLLHSWKQGDTLMDQFLKNYKGGLTPHEPDNYIRDVRTWTEKFENLKAFVRQVTNFVDARTSYP